MKMKKGLLSLLAVALTIVSCQDYDDQFAELTGLVNTLSTKVAGIETTTANLAALSATVSGLQTAIAAIPTTDSTADLTAVLDGLTAAQADIDAIELILANGVASADDLAAIDVLIDTVQAGVNTLLTNNQSISVNITIVDSETLASAQGYIEIGATTPAGYLLGGNLLVDHDGLTAAEIVTANEMTAKLISVSGTVSVTGAVNLGGLSYIAGVYTKNGTLSPLDTTITSLGSHLAVDGRIGAVTFPNLSSVLGNVSISNQASVTSIDFSSVTTVGPTSSIAALSVASATSVNTGGFIATTVTANEATSVILGQKTAVNLTVIAAKAASVSAPALTASTGTVKVSAAKATSIEMNLLTSVTTELEITAANSTTVVKFNKLTSTLLLDGDQVEVKEFHIPAFVTTTGDIGIKAMTINATKLATISAAGNVTFASGSIIASAIASVTGDYIVTAGSNGIQNVNIPLAVFATAGTITAAVTSVTIAHTADATLENVLTAGNTTLSLTSQGIAVTGLDGGTSDDLTTLTLSGKLSALGVPAYAYVHDVSEMAALKYLTVGNVTTVTVPTTSVIGTMTTTGKITDISIIDADVLYTLNIGHGPHTYEDAPAQSVTLQNLAQLKAVDLSTVTKLDNALIGVVANPKLATITAPALGSPLLANGVVSILISANALVATATAAEPGTALAEIKSPSLTGWKAYIGQMVTAGIVAAVSATDTDTFTASGGTMVVGIDYDKTGAAAGNLYETYSAGTNPLISGGVEVALIDSND